MHDYIYLIDESLWKSLLAWLKYGYVPMVLVLLLAYTNKQCRGKVIELLELVNWISLACAVLITLSWISSVIYFLLYSTQEERFIASNRWTGPYAYGYVWLLLAQCAPLLFFIRKWRTTFWLPVIILVFGYPSEVIVFVTNLLDNESGSWTIKYYLDFALKHMIGFTLYSIVLGIVYWTKKKYDARIY